MIVNIRSRLERRKGKVKFPVESTRSPQRRVNGIWTVGGTDHDHLTTSIHTVISARSVETIEAWIWSCFDDRTGANPSISSKKIMLGWQLRASRTEDEVGRSASPTHFDRQSAPLRMKKAGSYEKGFVVWKVA